MFSQQKLINIFYVIQTEINVSILVSHLVADHVDLVLHLWNPLTHDGEQLGDGGPRIHEDLQTGRVIWVEEGEGWRRMEKRNS